MTKKALCLVSIFMLLPALAFCQETILASLDKFPGVVVTKKKSPHYKEYYELMLPQPLDHSNPESKKFKQKVIVGYNGAESPTIMDIQGYAIQSINDMPELIKCNLIMVEHRYFGQSVPDSLDWRYLTVKQAADDCHTIRELFRDIMPGKWMTTGFSKGGQAALAYKMHYPNDVDATLLYSTPVKNKMVDNRIEAFMKRTATSECGRKVTAFQKLAFRKKKDLVPLFQNFAVKSGLKFTSLEPESVFDYMLLEYPFSFWQNCNDCDVIPDSTDSHTDILQHIITVIPPRFYSDENIKIINPAFYMFYHELGYYEYDEAPFKKWLKNKDYPNRVFAPGRDSIPFNDTYLKQLTVFLTGKKANNIMFIYGALDPWAAVQAQLKFNKSSVKYIVKTGCHRSRIYQLPVEFQNQAFTLLSFWLQWDVGK